MWNVVHSVNTLFMCSNLPDVMKEGARPTDARRQARLNPINQLECALGTAVREMFAVQTPTARDAENSENPQNSLGLNVMHKPYLGSVPNDCERTPYDQRI